MPSMTGRDAVRYFVECHHTGQIKSLFFNYAPNRHFRPYDLVCVHKNKVTKYVCKSSVRGSNYLARKNEIKKKRKVREVRKKKFKVVEKLGKFKILENLRSQF